MGAEFCRWAGRFVSMFEDSEWRCLRVSGGLLNVLFSLR